MTRLRQAQFDSGLSVAELARKLGLKYSGVYSVLSGNPTRGPVYEIVRAFLENGTLPPAPVAPSITQEPAPSIDTPPPSSHAPVVYLPPQRSCDDPLLAQSLAAEKLAEAGRDLHHAQQIFTQAQSAWLSALSMAEAVGIRVANSEPKQEAAAA